MIHALTIQNFILIDHLDLKLKDGLIVLSGETGAGKSLILKSLEFIMGAKLALKAKDESKPLSVTAEFDSYTHLNALLEDAGIERADTLLIRRTLSPSGTSKAFINDTPISLQFLKTITSEILEFVGQFETIHLTDEKYHLSLLDTFAQNQNLAQELASCYQDLTQAQKTLNDTQNTFEALQKDAQFYEEGVKELEDLNPEIGEEAKLVDMRRTLAHSEKILNHLSEAHAYLNEESGALKMLYGAEKTLLKIPADMVQMDDFFDKMNAIQNDIGHMMTRLEDQKEGFLEALPHFESLDDRLHALRDMARKYKVHPDDLPNIQNDLSEKILALQNLEKTLKDLQKEIAEHQKKYMDLANDLSKTRAEASKKLEKAVNANIKDLQWKNVSFNVSHVFDETKKPTNHGLDTIIFKVKTNAGQPFELIGKVASGGERSRLLLALKAALSIHKKGGNAGTIIFDEIDTGVGGATAEAVGQMLKNLSDNMQVMLITHAPQVAGLSHQHFLISKHTEKNQTYTKALELDENQKQEEIARMLSGQNISNEARAAARKLMVS